MRKIKDKSQSPKSQVDRIIFAVREAIMQGRPEFCPGATVSEQILADLVTGPNRPSRAPSREAIRHFETLGLMKASPKRGTIMRPLTKDELSDIWRFRQSLEEFAVVQLAIMQRPLDDVRVIHATMKAFIPEDHELDSSPTEEERFAYLRLDEQFHHQLCKSAGYPKLAEELDNIRLKLRYATNGVTLLKTKRRMKAIFEEHDDILSTLEADGMGIRPDLNRVRHAFRIHLRNSGRDSWRIALQVASEEHGPGSDPGDVFGLPDLPPRQSRSEGADMTQIPLEHLFLLRVALESCAVWNLVKQPKTSLDPLHSLLLRMRALHRSFGDDQAIPDAGSAAFAGSDLIFHSLICTLGGLLFGAELVSFTWTKIHDLAKKPLTKLDMERIVNDHDQILQAISRGRTNEDPETAIVSLRKHLCGAYLHHNEIDREIDVSPTERMLRDLADALKQGRLKQVLDGPDLKQSAATE